MPHQPQLDDEVVDYLLSLRFRQRALFEVAFEVNVEEGGYPADRVRRAVLLLDRAQIAEIKPLHRLFGVHSGTGDVAAVLRRHGLEPVHEVYLLIKFLDEADIIFRHRLFLQGFLVLLLAVDEIVHAVKGDPAIVADYPAARIGVGKTGDHARVARRAHLLAVNMEDRVIMRGAIGEFFKDLVRKLIAVRLASLLAHSQSRKRIDRPLQGRVRLQAHDDVPFPVHITGRKSQNG